MTQQQEFLKGIQKILKQLPWLMGERVFASFLIFALLAVIIGGFVFYSQRTAFGREPEQVSSGFEADLYKKTFEILDLREKEFIKADKADYPDIFRQLPR